MAVTGHVSDADLRLIEVDRLVNSHTLRSSESLCRLLRYLADHAIKHPGVAVKEYQIATEVFSRAADFDPHVDSLVRVQAGRLRSKLFEYYASEGIEDPIIVELPKGTYALGFHPTSISTKTILRVAQEAETKTADVPPKLSKPVVVLSLVLTAALIVIAFLGISVLRNASAISGGVDAPAALRVFWGKFASGPDEPLVIFSNGAFVGRPETGLRYFNPSKDSQQPIMDHYTGVGEVLAVYDLDHVLGRLHRQIRVKRGSLFTLDDAQNNDLIFVGSPAENLTLRDLPSTHEFVFERVQAGSRRGDLALVNLHPQPQEPKMFLSSPPGTPLTEDYAIVGLAPGLNPARSVLILAGTTTIGTQAAAEYVSREDSLEQLLLRLSVSDSGEMRPFEAVLRVKVVRGVPVGSELLALRKASQ